MNLDVSADDSDDVGAGLVALVVTVLELLVEAMEREAIRRMEAGDLTDEEIERVGATLQAVEAEIERIKRDEGVAEQSAQLREDLDGLVERALTRVENSEDRYGPIRADSPEG